MGDSSQLGWMQSIYGDGLQPALVNKHSDLRTANQQASSSQLRFARSGP